MSERTAPALATIDALLPLIRGLAPGEDQAQLVEEAEALRRAVDAFHMEAIRFRMYSVDRLIHKLGDEAPVREAFEQTRTAVEAAGFHTRSHSAPTASA